MEPAAVRDEIARWFTTRLGEGVYAGPLEVRVDRDEVLLVGPVDEPSAPVGADGDGARRALCAAAVQRFREETRDARTAVAREAEHLFGRKVSWGATCGPVQVVFTSLSVPVMTRLRLPEREVLDTLVDASVARSRSEALAWCVRMVGRHEQAWLAELQGALTHVERVRDAGPRSGGPDDAGATGPEDAAPEGGA